MLKRRIRLDFESLPEWMATAASSAKRKSLMSTFRSFVFALRCEKLNSFPSDVEWRKMPSVECPKACMSATAKKMPKRAGASRHPCFTPLQMSKGSEDWPSNCTTPFMLQWNDWIMLSNLDGHPIFPRIFKSPSWLTRSKALVRFINAKYSGCLCSLHFSCS